VYNPPHWLCAVLRRILRGLYSSALWFSGFWFTVAGIAVLIHQDLSNWHALPHFMAGGPLLFFAGRRLIRGFRDARWLGRTARTLLILGIVGSAWYANAYLIPALSGADGRTQHLVDEHEFDIVRWQLQANAEDFAEFATFWWSPERMDPAEERETVLRYFALHETISEFEQRSRVPAGTLRSQQETLAAAEAQLLARARAEQKELERDAERILSRQVSELYQELGLAIPWYQRLWHAMQSSEFRFEPKLQQVVVAERDAIVIIEKHKLQPDLTDAERDALEQEIDERGYSALVVGLGGTSTSPSIVVPRSLRGTLRTVAHEKFHIWLATYPLGPANSAESKIIEETAASIVGDTIGDLLYCRIYDASACEQKPESSASEPDPNWFDVRPELRETLLTTEQMLAEGNIEEAETYMEARRVWMCEQGYCERKINQAYFAFYGQYADNAAFADANGGLGQNVQDLWDQRASIREFFETIREIVSREALHAALKQ